MTTRGEQGRRRGGGVAVSGSGSVTIEPDIASLSVGVNWRDPSLETARDAVATKATAARDHLLAKGVAPSDLQTSQLSVHSVRHHDASAAADGTPVVQYVVATTVTAVFRHDITRAQVAVDGLFDVVGDGLELHGLGFDRGDRTAARFEARRLAFVDAQAKAMQLAELAGADLGPVRSMREDGGGFHPAPVARRAAMVAESSIPVEGGSLVETVELHVRWALTSPEQES